MLRFLSLCILVLAAAGGLAALVMLEAAPLVERQGPPSPEDVRDVRALVHQVRRITEHPEAGTALTVDLETMESAARMASRALPGLRGEAEVADGTLLLRGSLPVPVVDRWINVRVAVPPFADGPVLSEVRVGRLDLPPGLALQAGRIAANLVLGDAAGDRIVSSVPRMVPEGGAIAVDLAMDREDRGSIARGTFAALRQGEMPSAGEIADEYVAIREAMDAGQLPDRGSVVPYLRFVTLRGAAGDEPGRAFTAALLALTRACSDPSFDLMMGRLMEDVPESRREWRTTCNGVTLAGRVDLKRHFITSAALQAVSTRDASLAMGEFKELFDSLSQRNGFDFTDILGDSAGIRFAARILEAEPSDWPVLADRLTDEASVIPPQDGIPGRLPRVEFEARFGTIDSPAYREMLAEIERRIDRLRLHAS